ncbi:hypothetical protein T492DRAFT_923232 [Pavlovales sp. CCMP2436]|nr:hypothetical protein T492DRAFT_923232 [Pavlovales sp. CCMP2436]
MDDSMLIQHISGAPAFSGTRFADWAGTLLHLDATGAVHEVVFKARTPNSKPAKARSDGKPEPDYGSRPFLGRRMLSASVGLEFTRLEAVLAALLQAKLLAPSLRAAKAMLSSASTAFRSCNALGVAYPHAPTSAPAAAEPERAAPQQPFWDVPAHEVLQPYIDRVRAERAAPTGAKVAAVRIALGVWMGTALATMAKHAAELLPAAGSELAKDLRAAVWLGRVHEWMGASLLRPPPAISSAPPQPVPAAAPVGTPANACSPDGASAEQLPTTEDTPLPGARAPQSLVGAPGVTTPRRRACRTLELVQLPTTELENLVSDVQGALARRQRRTNDSGGEPASAPPLHDVFNANGRATSGMSV